MLEDTTSMPYISALLVMFTTEIVINEAGIYSILKRPNTASTMNHLELNNEIVKSRCQGMYQILTAISSKSLSTMSIPDDWCMAKVVPIFKSSDHTSLLNYQLISLTSTSCKLLEHIIHSEIINHLKSHIIFKYQHSFHKDYSC